MNECVKGLYVVAKSTDELLAGHYSSLNSFEIKHSAEVLRSSVQNCLATVSDSEALFKKRLETCLCVLDAAESLWQSKQKVTELPSTLIWEKIGDVSGRWNRIQELADDRKLEVTDQARLVWLTQISELKQRFFFDSKNRYRETIGWFDKDEFNRELPGKLSFVSEHLDQGIKVALKQLLEELSSNIFPMQELIKLLDQQAQLQLYAEQANSLSKLRERFSSPLGKLANAHNLSLYQGVFGIMEEWRKRFGDISWKEVEKFRDTAFVKIEERVELTINDRLNITQTTLERSISFYNDFLDKQNRYRQETPEQRKAEKIWIDWQRQHLQRLLNNLEQGLKLS